MFLFVNAGSEAEECPVRHHHRSQEWRHGLCPPGGHRGGQPQDGHDHLRLHHGA